MAMQINRTKKKNYKQALTTYAHMRRSRVRPPPGASTFTQQTSALRVIMSEVVDFSFLHYRHAANSRPTAGRRFS